MGLAQNPSPPDYPSYPQELQIKLYQVFMFPVPILFCIIPLLLFYLFYHKRSSSMLSSPPPILPGSLHDASSFPPLNLGLKGEMIKKLCIVLDDEDLRQKNLQRSCTKYHPANMSFHLGCIAHWLHSSPTCPLCRRFTHHPPPAICHLPPLPHVQHQQEQERESCARFGSTISGSSSAER
ncbi:hypothetical protein NMG60_11033035 [Bertholletia excelsa]